MGRRQRDRPSPRGKAERTSWIGLASFSSSIPTTSPGDRHLSPAYTAATSLWPPCLPSPLPPTPLCPAHLQLVAGLLHGTSTLLTSQLKALGGPCGRPRTVLSLRLQHRLGLLPIPKLLPFLKHSPLWSFFRPSSVWTLCLEGRTDTAPHPGTLDALSQDSGPPEGPVDGQRGGGLLFGPLL